MAYNRYLGDAVHQWAFCSADAVLRLDRTICLLPCSAPDEYRSSR
jgi:hypothetical protein